MPLTTSKTIRVGHSPDPDDAFMFYALAKERVPLRGFRVEHVIEEIESLNHRALQGELEVTAVSCHAYAYLADHYEVFRSGASVGDKYGPILVARKDRGSASCPDIRGRRIAIPGKLTTAYLVLQLFERDFEPVFIPFDQVLEAVRSGSVDLGLVIHEGQLTYRDLDLEKILDLGRWWHDKHGLPLPLGVDVIRRDLGKETIQSFAGVFKASIQYALAHRQEALKYALQYGRGITEKVGDQFVAMYVNDFTVDLGEKGEAGFRKLLDEAYEKGILRNRVPLKFVERI